VCKQFWLEGLTVTRGEDGVWILLSDDKLLFAIGELSKMSCLFDVHRAATTCWLAVFTTGRISVNQ